MLWLNMAKSILIIALLVLHIRQLSLFLFDDPSLIRVFVCVLLGGEFLQLGEFFFPF